MNKEIFMSKNLLLDEACINIINKRMVSIFRSTKRFNFQDSVDSYFFRKGKEIEYVFLFDKNRKNDVDDLIKAEKNEDRILELELLKKGLGYKLEDIEKYSEKYTNSMLIEKITYSYEGKSFGLYEKIKIENIDNNLIKIIKTSIDNVKSNNNMKSSIEDEFKKYHDVLEKFDLLKFYKISKKKDTISIKKGSVKQILEIIKESKDNYNQLKDFLFIKDLVKGQINKKYKEEKEEYIFFLKVNSKYIDYNKEIYNSKLKKLKNNDNIDVQKLIYGVFISGRIHVSPKNNKHEGFFTISNSVYKALLNSILKDEDMINNLELEYDGFDVNISIDKLKTILLESIEKKSYDKIIKKITDRLNRYTNLNKKAIETKNN